MGGRAVHASRSLTLCSPSPQRHSYDVAGDGTRTIRQGDPTPAPSGRGNGAREMGGLSLSDALSLCELLATADPARYERAALRWLQRFIDERLPPLTEVSACCVSARRAAARQPLHRSRGAETLGPPRLAEYGRAESSSRGADRRIGPL
jgi:hypothetical protein